MMSSFRKLYERLIYLRNLEEKKEQVLSSIEEQGKLTEELKQQILAAETLVVRGRSVPAVPTKASYQGDHREGKGVWNHWQQLLLLQKTYGTMWKKIAEAYISQEKRCCRSASEAVDRGERYHCRVHFR